MNRRFYSSLIIFGLAVSLVSTAAFAGGPFRVTADGEPSRWPGTITLHPESGDCAGSDSAAMLTNLANNVAEWEPIVDFDIQANVLNVDVDIDNYDDYYVDRTSDPGAQDNIHPVVFDNTGEIVNEIFDALQGCGNSCQYEILGFAGPDLFTEDLSTIVDGQAFFNCKCLPGNVNGPCNEGDGNYTLQEVALDFIIVHEIGHLIGLDHTQVNASLSGTCVPDDEEGIGDVDCESLPTMYPASVDPADQVSPTRDDIVALSTIYDRADLEDDFCTVRGSLLDTDGNPLRCADVQAVTDDPADSIAVVSGVFAANSSENGQFILRGLDPALTYTINVRRINSGFTGGSGIGPCTTQNSNIVNEEIATVQAGSCLAGDTENLGSIQTLSSAGSSGSGGGLSSCSLTPHQGPQTLGVVGGLLLLVFGWGVALRGRRARAVL